MDQLNEALALLREAPQLAWAGGALTALLIGLWLGRRSRPMSRTTTRGPVQDRSAVRELQKTNARLESENAALSNFFQLLPDFTKEINSRMERRAVAPLLVTMVLSHQKGLSEDVTMRFEIGLGEGRIGWVAEHKVAMDVNDFIQEMRHSGTSIDLPAHSRFRTELCAPLVYQHQVVGVISIGGVSRHYKYEKTILSLIADLGSIALFNSQLFSQVLTKLFNKRFFLEKLGAEIVKAEGGHYPVSVFIFDLDHFKHYNDTQGHQAGDEVLKMIGQILKEMVRQDDIPARYGGEEFIVFLPQTPKDGAMRAAEKIRERVAAHPFANRESQPLGLVSLSGGVSTFPDDGRTGADLIAAADQALYRAKKAGRNQVARSAPNYFSDESDELIYNSGRG
jgi:diguanylate cyclase (GGDEF)-like protein